MNNKDDDEKTLLSCLSIALYAFLVLPFSALFNGWVLSVMWKWFIVPFGVADIDIAWAIGISLILSFLKGGYSSWEKNNKDKVSYILLSGLYVAFVPGLIILGLGYIVQLFM